MHPDYVPEFALALVTNAQYHRSIANQFPQCELARARAERAEKALRHSYGRIGEHVRAHVPTL
jgi:hypothetical protein